jgi:hypothetical protein
MARPPLLLIFVVGLFSAAGSLAGQETDSGILPAASVHVENVSLENVQSDRLLLNAHLSLDPKRSATLDGVSFSSMRLNDMPVYIAPIHEKFEMKKDVLLALPEVEITVYYRDLANLDSVHNVIEEEKVRLAGQISAAIQANLLEKLALHSMHPKIVLPFSKEMPITIPGGAIGRTAALAVVDVAQGASGPAGQILGSILPGQNGTWRSDLNSHQVQHLLLIHTTYTVVADKTNYPMEFDQLGFWVGPSTVLIPEEAVRPWEFDPEAGMQFADRKAHVDKSSIDIRVQPLSSAANSAWSLSQGDFKIEFEGEPENDKFTVASSISPIELRQRASAGNYALLRFRDGIQGKPVQMTNSAQTEWDRFGIFRLVRASSGGALQVEVVFLPGTLDGRQLHFGEQIDDSAFGSPVFTPDGVIGMVQDESAAALLTGMKHLPGAGE